MKHLPKIIYLALTFCITISTVHAQQHVPGFLGKRFFVEAQLAPTVYYQHLLSSSVVSDEPPRSPVSIVPKISLNYITARSYYVALELEQSQLTHEVTNVNNLAGVEQVDLRVTLRRAGLGFYRTTRRRKGVSTLAPIGRYVGTRIFYGQLSGKPTTFVTDGSVTEQDAMDRYDSGYENPEVGFVGFAIALGNRTMLNDQIALSLGLDFGYNLFLSSQVYSDFNRRQLVSEFTIDRYGRSTFGIHIGLAALLF
ncbi:MAG: hypothetical protein AAFY48_12840 [Bacteroidota bacterium]